MAGSKRLALKAGSKRPHWLAQPCPKWLIIALYKSIWIPRKRCPRCWGDLGCTAAREPSAGAPHVDALLSLRTLWCLSLLATAFQSCWLQWIFSIFIKKLGLNLWPFCQADLFVKVVSLVEIFIFKNQPFKLVFSVHCPINLREQIVQQNIGETLFPLTLVGFSYRLSQRWSLRLICLLAERKV